MKPTIPQIPGCLPNGYNENSLLTIQQFAIWRQKSKKRVQNELSVTPGVVGGTRKDQRIHPRTYLERRLKGVK